jgi:hypothetical protein
MAAPIQQAVLNRPYIHGEPPEPGWSESLAKQNTRESTATVYPRPYSSFAPIRQLYNDRVIVHSTRISGAAFSLTPIDPESLVSTCKKWGPSCQ